MAPRGPRAPDQDERDAAICERGRNVLVDAGAGTGKTTILVDRLVEMVAPTSDEPAVPIDRVAAITFTRKAAGELRLRIRERLLQELAQPDQSTRRRDQLREAVTGLDTAHVGTIHSFADRLLRLRPVEAELSPSYEVADDADELLRETAGVLLRAAQNGTLAAELAGTGAAARADEAAMTVLFALETGLRAESRDTEYYVYHGLDALVAGFANQRDVPPVDCEAAPFDAEAFGAAATELAALGGGIRGDSTGAAWIRGMAEVCTRVQSFTQPLMILRELGPQLDRAPRGRVTRRDTFEDDRAAWDVWKTYDDGGKRRARPLRDDLCGPLDRWRATRLVRLFPVVVALYEKVKARRRTLDQLDLLVKLRDLLLTRPAVRADFQRLFDHVFVDEFQDTDPLQAEIILFLCEQAPAARRWQDVVLRQGALTLVGDPKQSIYRFRRADVAMYDGVRQVVGRHGPLHVTLSASFRSLPPLIEWINDRFDRILGRSPDGRHFDPATGQVFQQALVPGRPGGRAPAVHVLSFAFPDAANHKVEEYRALEGQVLARYLRWLVASSGLEIADALEDRPRPVRYGDIAVLAVSTWSLWALFPWLDGEGIPYASRGGRLFLQDPLSRQFLLGLRALADRDDGVAEAALLRPPFFALDPADLLLERAARSGLAVSDAEALRRVEQARGLIQELRRARLDQPPGATARDLLDRTALARAVATGPNGAQRLARLRELCLVVAQTAAGEGFDYDAVTAGLREWVTDPVELDPPYPVGGEAMQILTVHQAKGLEFPVVVLWDARLAWDTRVDLGAWHMDRHGGGWIMSLAGLDWEEPAGLDLRRTEKAYLDAERRRVVYVAATRARDLLVVPEAGRSDPGKLIASALLDGAPAALVRRLEPHVPGRAPAWFTAAPAPPVTAPGDADALERSVADRFAAGAAEAGRPRFRPASVSGEAQAAPVAPLEGDGEAPAAAIAKPRAGRFGAVFGSTVHQAIGMALHDRSVGPAEAVRRAAGVTGLGDRLDEAAADVDRALAALESAGLRRPPGPDLRIEYPVAGAATGGVLLGGYVDLVSATARQLDVLDFKTDAPPAGAVEGQYPEYVRQLRSYADLLAAAGIPAGRAVRCGLLFTADGGIRWLAPA